MKKKGFMKKTLRMINMCSITLADRIMVSLNTCAKVSVRIKIKMIMDVKKPNDVLVNIKYEAKINVKNVTEVIGLG